MSDTAPPAAPKPARKPRKSTPRKRKPTNKSEQSAAAETSASLGNANAIVVTSAAKPAKQAALPSAAPIPTLLIRVHIPVRWRDLDAFNHVNNSTYLSYLEEARLQWMLTVPGQGLDDHVAPVVAAANLNYRRPIEWPNDVDIELFVERLGTTSVGIGHRIVARDDANVLYCDGNVVMVWIDRGTGTAAPLPAAVREACS